MVFAADEAHFHGVAAAILSIRAHSASPASLRFNLVTQPAHTEAAAAALKCYGAAATVIALPEAWLAGRIRVEASANITGNLASPCNFARFFLPKLLPGVRRVLYLDADVVVQADVASLFELSMPAGALAAAVQRSEPHFRYKRYAARAGETFAKRYRARQVRLDGTKPTFNAGVMLADLDAWRAATLTEDAVWWLEQHAASPDGLWHLGSQPPMHLILYGRWAPLPPRWNLPNLGRIANLRTQELDAANLLHWTGKRKPWLPDALYPERWRRYVPQACVAPANRSAPWRRAPWPRVRLG